MGTQILKCPACGAVVTGEGNTCNYCGARLLIPETKHAPGKQNIDKELEELLKAGNFLQAIKRYKDNSGKGLKESKEYVESFARNKGIEIKKGCFVATACYGDYRAPEVLILRKYRDEKLALTFTGRAFMRFYYAVSPYLAKFISRSSFLKRAIRNGLLGPLVKRLSTKYRAG